MPTRKSIEELKGSFVQAIAIDPWNIEEFAELGALPCDMLQEIEKEVGETRGFALFVTVDGTNYCYLPSVGRGGVCSNGLTDWTDCSGLDDLEFRWKTYATNWAN